MQLETLEAFYYGEVDIDIFAEWNKHGKQYFNRIRYMWRGRDMDISGRVRSLFNRKLIRAYFWGEGTYDITVVVLPAGVEELEKINA